MDSTLSTFIRRADVTVTATRKLQTWLVNYENPRTLQDSALAHALFISSPAGDDVRSRTFEALIIECLLSQIASKVKLSTINNWLAQQGCPELPDSMLSKIAKNSQYLLVNSNNEVELQSNSLNKFTELRNEYANKFEYCIAVHRIPQGQKPVNDIEAAQKELLKDGIDLVALSPFKSMEELGQVYNDVHTAKDAKDRSPETLFSIGVDHFHDRVLHDANCIDTLINQNGENPYSSQNVFVTCDFYLARIRRVRPELYGFLTTAPEFFEFMLPYLFGADTVSKQPIETPNFLLASALSAEMHKGLGLTHLYGNFLADQTKTSSKKYEILGEIYNSERYQKIQKKWKEDKVSPHQSAVDASLIEVQLGFSDYLTSVRADLEESIYVSERNNLNKRLTKSEKENIQLKQELEKLKRKECSREKHDRRLKKD